MTNPNQLMKTNQPRRLIVQERLAHNNQADEVAQAGFPAVEFRKNLIDGWSVADFEFTAQGVDH